MKIRLKNMRIKKTSNDRIKFRKSLKLGKPVRRKSIYSGRIHITDISIRRFGRIKEV
jgi:hypothetical protein